MTTTPWVSLYPQDFLADIGHLGNTELGIYWRLLLVYYRDGKPLPFDTDRLRRLAMCFSPEEYRALDAVVPEFFRLSIEPDGRQVWRHARADREMASAQAKHAAASAKASAAAAARWSGKHAAGNAPSNAQGNSRSNACEMPTTTTTTTTTTVGEFGGIPDVVGTPSEAPRKRSAEKPASRGTRLPQDWALPKAWGDWAVSELNMQPEAIRLEAAKFADYWRAKTGRDATKADWLATWRNWCRTALERAPRQVAQRMPAGRQVLTDDDRRKDRERAAQILGFDPHGGDILEGEVLQ